MNDTEISTIPPFEVADIESLIHVVRGQQVMLDSDLAALYQVETRTLNQNVRRNPARFPESFCFQLTKEEHDRLISQTVISNATSGRGGTRKPPLAFTEQGVAMLSAVLRSETAIAVSVRIMNAFVEMRRFIASNALMLGRIDAVERRQLDHEKQADEKFDRIFDRLDEREEPSQRVFFDGQIYDAFSLIVGLVQRADREIVLIDNYVDLGTLNILAKKNPGVKALVHTLDNKKLSPLDIKAFNSQYPSLEVRYTTAFHDRFLILDGRDAYHIGASIKDAGKKSFAISPLADEALAHGILQRLGAPSLTPPDAA